jgi:hypothetical protein
MNLDDELRRSLHDHRYALPGWPDATSRVRAGMVRRHRRRVAGAAAATAIALIALAVPVALQAQRHPPPPSQPRVTPAPGQIIPWLDQPTTAPRGTPATGPATATDEPCDWGELSATAQPSTAEGGTLYTVIAATNLAAGPCTLNGSPALGGIPDLTNVRTTDDVPVGAQTPATIGRGETAHVRIGTSTDCAAPAKTYRSIALWTKLPVDGLELTSSCPVTVGRWYRLAPGATGGATSAETSPIYAQYDQLVAHLEVSSSVVHSNDLRYVVTLQNPTTQWIELNPCPVLVQSLGTDGGWYGMNCTVNVMPPGAWIRLRMVLHVSADAPLGAATLHWAIATPSGEFAAVDTDVTIR